MTNFADTVDSDFQHILVFGPPKSGKSVLVGQLAKHFRLVWLDLDGGVKALRHNVPSEYHHNIEVLRLPDSKQFPVAIETVLRIFTGAAVEICDLHGVHSCLACKRNPDTIWTHFKLIDLGPTDILVIDHAAQLAASAINLITKGKGDEYKPDWDDWAKLGNIMDRIFSHIQTGQYHCCVITHEMGIEQEDGKEKLMPVCGTRNYSRTFAKFFDHVIYSELLNKKHKFSSSTTATLNALTGSRTNVALEKEATPELWEIFSDKAFSRTPSINEQQPTDIDTAAKVLASLKTQST